MDFKKWLDEHDMSFTDFQNRSGVAYLSLKKYANGETSRIQRQTLKKIEKCMDQISNGVYSTTKEQYKPKVMPVDDLWSYLPKEIQYVAQDKKGDVYGYDSEPYISGEEYVCDGMANKIIISVDFGTDNWRETKTQRPCNFWDYLGKYGLFYDDDPNNAIFGQLEGISSDSENPFKRKGGFRYTNFRPLSLQEISELAK